jgi:hypothetical protein
MGARHYDPATGRFPPARSARDRGQRALRVRGQQPLRVLGSDGARAGLPCRGGRRHLQPTTRSWRPCLQLRLRRRCRNFRAGDRSRSEIFGLAQSLDSWTGGALSTVAGGINRVSETLLGPSCDGCYIGGAPSVGIPLGAAGRTTQLFRAIGQSELDDVPNSLLTRGTVFTDVGGAGRSVQFADDVLLDLYQQTGLPRILDAPWVPKVGP